MSQGRIGRSVRRYPDAQRRISRYGDSRYGRRGRGLPPNLVPGISRPKKGSPVFSRRNFIIGFFGLAFVTVMTFLAITATSAIAGVIGTVRAYRKVNADLPNAAAIAVDTFQTTRIFDRNGSLLQEVDNPDYGWRTFVPLDKVSTYLIDATVAAEDSTFWNNYGVEPFAIIRGGIINLSGTGSSGGSTITQQLVRAVYPDKISALDISYTRKFREALAAIALAQEYSKEDILTMYINQIYYGGRSYGVEAASQTFFRKHASELTLAEAALLAGLPQAPSAYDPSTPDGATCSTRCGSTSTSPGPRRKPPGPSRSRSPRSHGRACSAPRRTSPSTCGATSTRSSVRRPSTAGWTSTPPSTSICSRPPKSWSPRASPTCSNTSATTGRWS
jgi:hypothetical protein